MGIQEEAIRVEGLQRVYGEVVAVEGISFEVRVGEIFGFLGPNGAGKTTTIRMLTGQLTPTAGQAYVAGCDVVAERRSLKQRIGVVFEVQNLYERMSAYENLAFYASLYRVEKPRIFEVLELVHLADRAHEPVRHFSNGMKQRLLIARALLHRPQVLFLDEPTRGLDPVISREIRRTVLELVEQGMTVFLTTHYMEEADQLCDRLAIIDQGRIVALDTPARLKRQATSGRNVCVILQDEQEVTLSLERPEDVQQLCTWLSAGKVLSVHSQEATLEDVFIQLTGRSLVQ